MPRCSACSKAWSTAIRADPDVIGVVSVVGVTPIESDAQCRPPRDHAASPRDERASFVTGVIERLKRAVARHPGHDVYFQPVQDIQIGTRSARALYQYTLSGTEAAVVDRWADALVERLRSEPLLREVASEAQDGGLRVDINVDREKAGRLGVSMQAVSDTLNDAFGQRQISTIFGQANQYRVILEAMPEYQRDPSTLSKLYLPGRQFDVAGNFIQFDIKQRVPAHQFEQSRPAQRRSPLSRAPRRRSPSCTRTSSRR